MIIPAFAVGRAQTVLYYLSKLMKEQSIPKVPIYLDSPMAISATNILNRHIEDHHLSKEEIHELNGVAICTNSQQESIEIDADRKPKIIISASGMATGGRVLYHLQTYGVDEKSTILFTGYQAGGTRGDRLLKGERLIKIHGQMIPIRAKVEITHNLSAHADYEEILTWLSHFRSPPTKTFVTHGEPEAALSLKNKISNQLRWNCVVPTYRQTEILS